MRHVIRSAALLACTAALCAAQVHTPESFRNELARLRSTLPDAGRIPEQWELDSEGRRYKIPTTPLTEALKKTPPDLDTAGQWLDQLSRHVTSGVPPGEGGERQRLTTILAREEFRRVAQPSAWEQFRARVIQWLAQLLVRLFSFLPSNVPGAEAIFWVLVTLAVGIAGMFLFRYWMRRGRSTVVMPAAVQTHEGRTWQEWLQAARAAADRNEAAEAIRCGYWAGVSRLQTDRLLPAKLSQTPRELVAHARQSHAPKATVDSLVTLTAGFERFWYGRNLPGSDDVRASFQHLETLGCRLD